MVEASPYSFFDVRSGFRAANEILYTLPDFHKPSDEDSLVTDAPPRIANQAGFLESDRIRTLDIPHTAGRAFADHRTIHRVGQ
jgi:hypothetical protein